MRILWHVGIKTADRSRWYPVVVTELEALRGKPVFIGLHATPEQEIELCQLCDEYQLQVEDVHHVPDDELWETHTIEWLVDTLLPQWAVDDYLLYFHTKSVSSGHRRTLDYLLDQVVLPVEERVAALQARDYLTFGCCGVLTRDFRSGYHFGNFWISRVDHLRTLEKPSRANRWCCESFLRLDVQRAMFAESVVALESEDALASHQYFNGDKWEPSEDLKSMLARVKVKVAQAVPDAWPIDDYTSEPAFDGPVPDTAYPGDKKFSGAARVPWWVHTAYASALLVLVAAVLVLVVLRLRGR